MFNVRRLILFININNFRWCKPVSKIFLFLLNSWIEYTEVLNGISMMFRSHHNHSLSVTLFHFGGLYLLFWRVLPVPGLMNTTFVFIDYNTYSLYILITLSPVSYVCITLTTPVHLSWTDFSRRWWLLKVGFLSFQIRTILNSDLYN